MANSKSVGLGFWAEGCVRRWRVGAERYSKSDACLPYSLQRGRDQGQPHVRYQYLPPHILDYCYTLDQTPYNRLTLRRPFANLPHAPYLQMVLPIPSADPAQWSHRGRAHGEFVNVGKKPIGNHNRLYTIPKDTRDLPKNGVYMHCAGVPWDLRSSWGLESAPRTQSMRSMRPGGGEPLSDGVGTLTSCNRICQGGQMAGVGQLDRVGVA